MDSQTGRVVVGYDGSQSADVAVDWAAREATRLKAPLTVLNVVDGLAEVVDQGVERARKASSTVDVTGIVIGGHVAHTILETSRGAALLVVGTRGRGEIAGAMIGSVSLTVSAHAHCPVVVVRGDSGRPPGPRRPVVVGVDGSNHADAALLFAADVAAGTAAPLIVVSAYQPSAAQVAAGVVLNTVQTPGWSNLEVPALDAANEVTTGAIKTVLNVHPNLDVKQQVRQGRADGVLSTAAYGAGLLVVGSRGHGGFVGLLLGSVSQGAIHLSPCPVAVVRTVPAGAV